MTDAVAQIKEKLDIVAVVSEHVTLTRKGKSYWGLCPFHNETAPSFTVNPERQIYKCFGCNEGGDVFSFVMKVKGLSFAEVLEDFAARTGVKLEREGRPERRVEKQSEHKAYYEAGRHALDFFTRMLASQEGVQARDYLRNRGLSNDTIKAFAIGYAPEGWDGLLTYLKKQGVSPETAGKCGLLVKKDTGGFYDRFRGRVMFPIRDLRGEVIAFGGRIIGPGEPKYINSPESPVFEKRKVLYNLVQAKPIVQARGAVVVEGYMDVVSLANAGFQGAVATLGTALGEDHIRLLKRFTGDITLVFDGDNAGRKAMYRALEPFLATGVSPKVAILPAGMDPDDLARQDIQRWNSLISEARNIWDFIFDESFSGRDPSKFENQSTVLKDLAPMIAQEQNAIARDLLVERLAIRLGVAPATVARHVHAKGETPKVVDTARDKGYIEEILVRLMLFDATAVRVVRDLNLAHAFQQEEIAQLVDYLVAHGNCIMDDMRCPDGIRMTAARFTALGPYAADGSKALVETVSKLLSLTYDGEIKRIQQALDQAEKDQHRERMKALLGERMAIVKAKQNVQTTVTEALVGR